MPNNVSMTVGFHHLNSNSPTVVTRTAEILVIEPRNFTFPRRRVYRVYLRNPALGNATSHVVPSHHRCWLLSSHSPTNLMHHHAWSCGTASLCVTTRIARPCGLNRMMRRSLQELLKRRSQIRNDSQNVGKAEGNVRATIHFAFSTCGRGEYMRQWTWKLSNPRKSSLSVGKHGGLGLFLCRAAFSLK
ncbi:hypothetical protein BDN67DRAFT_793402 [Paxillus ammoniavirescens]|nr:hypothetical protein BDN67DRAFT_793402 [Paxillus ammoniavirescens]